MTQRIAILGVGLIGGSLGLVWKKRLPGVRVVGLDQPEVLEVALRRSAIDEAALDAPAAVREADVVVLCTPLSSILRLLEEIAPHLKPGVVVTDVGSVKACVVNHARQVLPEAVTFIGGHPMAGSERSGVAHADAFLFENATYVLCPPAPASAAAFLASSAAFMALMEATGARLLILDPERHDRIAAAVSHLPQLLAVMLTDLAAGFNAHDDAFLRLAAGGFRDMTRVASSPFSMWRDVLVANQGLILDVLGEFAASVQKMRNRLIEEDLEALEQSFLSARHVRESIPRDSKGFLHPLAEVFVYTEDRPGALLDITRLLFEASVNIKDLELLKIREGTGGTFRLGFSDKASARAAVAALEAKNYTAYSL